MEINLSFLNFSDKATSTVLLQTVLDNIPIGIEVFKAVRRTNEIIDFEYILVNEVTKKWSGEQHLIGKKFSTQPNFSSHIFSRMVEVVETGNPFNTLRNFSAYGSVRLFADNYIKFNDGVILSVEDVTEKKLSNPDGNGAKAAEARIIDFSHDAVIGLDKDENINYWNPAAALIYDLSSELALGKKLDEVFLIEKKQAEFRQAMIHVFQNGGFIKELQVIAKQKDGRSMEMVINLFPVRGPKDDVTNCFLIIKDLTASRLTKDKLKEDEYFIGQILDTTADIIYIMDLNTYQTVYANRQVAAELGYTSAQIAGMKNSTFDIMHEDDIGPMKEHLKRIKTLASDDKVMEIEYRLKNPGEGHSWFCDRNRVFKRNSKGIPVEKIAVCQNITHKKKKEEEELTNLSIIHQSEEIVAMGSWEFDILTDEFKWSEGMYRLFNIANGTRVRPEIYLDFAPENGKPKVRKLVNNIIHDFVPFEETITIITSENEKKILKIKAVVQKEKNGKPVKVIGVDLDITQQVKDSEEIRDLYHTLLKKKPRPACIR